MTDHRRPQPFWEEYHSDGAESDVTVVKSSSHSAAGQQGHAILLPGIPDQNYDGSARHGSGAMVKYKERREDRGDSVSESSASSHRRRNQGVHTPGSVNRHPNSGNQYNDHSPPSPTKSTRSFDFNADNESLTTSDTTTRHRRSRKPQSNNNYGYVDEAWVDKKERLGGRFEPKGHEPSEGSHRPETCARRH